MKNLIGIAVAVSLLSGCVVNTPAPAPQVTAVASAPADMWCNSEASTSGKTKPLGIAFVRDYGNHFTVINRAGEITLVSPKLNQNRHSAKVGFNEKGLLFSKGTGNYTGFYGVFLFTKSGSDSITFDCR